MFSTSKVCDHCRVYKDPLLWDQFCGHRLCKECCGRSPCPVCLAALGDCPVCMESMVLKEMACGHLLCKKCGGLDPCPMCKTIGLFLQPVYASGQPPLPRVEIRVHGMTGVVNFEGDLAELLGLPVRGLVNYPEGWPDQRMYEHYKDGDVVEVLVLDDLQDAPLDIKRDGSDVVPSE